MKNILLKIIIIALTFSFIWGGELPVEAAQKSYTIEKVADGVYAALAIAGGAATSNGFIVDLGYYLVVGGAHLSKKAINDLTAAAAEISPKPIEFFVVAHHHKGFSFVDFDFPPGKNIIMTLQTRQAIKQEVRQINGQIIYFQEGFTIEGTERSVVLTNIGAAHSEGDLIAYIPQSKTLFTSDLVYVNSAGYLGDGPLRGWVIALEGISNIDAEKVIPGFGPVSTMKEVRDFKIYLKDFLTEVLSHIEKGENLATTIQNFSLPQYEDLPGYEIFKSGNIKRAYQQLSKKMN
ncbi:hypothetical protein [Geopsychrobacter electrodiphilus]|uniref:hypothetical protein n=1 Tax=Geopsychrobacter electrodiphilus TaxID=225196 RepID=UPI00036BEC36|nr:hypothetical protein [Geopsychrobacter electrodiphilus]